MEALGVEPLEQLGLSMLDVDDYGTSSTTPRSPSPGIGNVPERNYKTLAALAARRGDIAREAIPQFMAERGMPGSHRRRATSPPRCATFRMPCAG